MTGSTSAKALIVMIWIVAASIVIAIGLELFLTMRSSTRHEAKLIGKERYDEIARAYFPFAVQHINPNYLFFFPFDADEQIALGNEHVTLDGAGFRGPGPAFAEGRELAFLIGGSTAFSYSSTDSTTITGYLNRIQDRYFFVNAGVPSWNSTQELFRLSNQILEYDPALVIAFDGANEMAILVQYHEQGLDFPPGTPESFGQLQSLVGDIRSESRMRQGGGVFARLFPRLTTSITARLTATEPVAPLLTSDIEKTAGKYVFNLALMNTLVTSRGGRFVSIFQPIIWLHENGPEHEADYRYRDEYRLFHQRVFDDTTVAFERYDFADLFDARFDQIPYFDPADDEDLTDATVFLDPVHFFDAGNRMVAEEIVAHLW